jgi:hypothetical protein
VPPVTDRATPIPIDPGLTVDDDLAAARLHQLYRSALARFPRGPIESRGLPFQPADGAAGGRWLLIDRPVRLEIGGAVGPASHLVLLGFCDAWRDSTGARPIGTPLGWVQPVGEPLAELTVHPVDAAPLHVTLRRRFEVSEGIVGWGSVAFLAVPHRVERPLDPLGPHPRQQPGRRAPAGHSGPLTVLPGAWGPAQTGVQDHVPSPTDDLTLWLHALDLRSADGGPRTLGAIELAPLPGAGDGRLVVVAALTTFTGTDTPLRWLPRTSLRVEGAAGQPIEVDLGLVARRTALDAAELVEVTAAADAVLHVGDRRLPLDRPAGPVVALPPADRRLEVCLSGSDGAETPAKVRIVARDGRSLPPAGHQPEVNPGLYEDLGADVLIDAVAWAYVPGRFEVLVPADGATIEAVHGFAVAPVRADITPDDLARGSLDVAFGQSVMPSGAGWVCGDTHVHFLSPTTALLQARAEGVNIVHLLATQWGDHHSSVTDFGGDQQHQDGRHAVWVGSENRQNMLGHVGIVGTARPVLPFASGGPPEGMIGGPVTHLLADWLARCREQGGLAIGAHFPLPMAEIAADIDAGLLDALELQCFDHSLESPPIREWYRYLDAGYRLPLVGGTDKMTAEIPLGQIRTWARLDGDGPVTFERWAAAIRGGRTFVSSGPVLELRVEGSEPGNTVSAPVGTRLDVELVARAAQPVISAVELVVNGVVTDAATSDNPVSELRLMARPPVVRSGWLAGRSRSPLAIRSAFATAMAAHTSPVYLLVPGQPSPPADLSIPLALVDGTRAWLDHLAPIRDPRELERFRTFLAAAERRIRERR